MEEIQLTPFSDGVMFRCAQNGKGQWCLHDAANVVVAIVRDQYIADFLCKGAHMAFLSMQVQIEEAKKAQEAKDREAKEQSQLPLNDARKEAPLDNPPATL